jgi:hypothetical protein
MNDGWRWHAEGSGAGSKSKKVRTIGGAGERNRVLGTNFLNSSSCHVRFSVNR